MTTEKEEVTPWFPGSVKPLADRPGYYQRDYGKPALDLVPDFWDGNCWFYGDESGKTAHVASEQNRPWRGRSTPPATPANAKGSK